MGNLNSTRADGSPLLESSALSAHKGNAGGLVRPSQFSDAALLWRIMIVLVPVTGAALFFQLNTYPNHDVAWILWGTRELLMGATWGTDVIEPNPPLAWYLAMPTTAVAMWLNLPLDWTFRTSVALAAAISAGSFAWLLRGDGRRVRPVVLCAVAGVCLLLLPAREFGQREHLLAIAILPYLALASRRIGQQGFASTPVAIGIGLVAGLGIALKPYFIAVPLLVEVAVQTLNWRCAKLLRAENVALGSVLAIYFLFLLVFEQAYLGQVVPLAQEIYWSFDLPFEEIWGKLMLRLLVTVPFIAYAIYRRDALAIVLAAALCGVAASYLIQHKGYPYHLLPISIMSFVLFAHFLTVDRGLVRWAAVVALISLSIVCIFPTIAWWQVNQQGGARTVEIDRIRGSVAAHAHNGRFLIVAVHPYPTYPVSIYTSARHVSRTNSHWFMPAVVYNRMNAEKHGNVAMIEQHARDFMLHDLSEQPDLVMIDNNSGRHTVNSEHFNFLTFYQEDPAFRRAWKSYVEIEPLGSFRQFVRARQTMRPAGSRS